MKTSDLKEMPQNAGRATPTHLNFSNQEGEKKSHSFGERSLGAFKTKVFFFNIYLFLRQCDRVQAAEGQTEGDRESEAGSRL